MAKPSGGTSLDQALDELYGASPAEFTAKRDALAKGLKAAGDVAGAAEVKGRRKPTQLAYVLNQLARRHSNDLAGLVDVGRELARSQRKALRGESGHELRDAIARQRSVVAGLTTKTAALMGELGVSVTGHLDEIASALQAALVDPAVGARLEEGRLDKLPTPSAGFPGAAAQDLEAEPEERRRTAVEVKAHAVEERKEEARAKRKAAATRAGAEAVEKARIAEAAEREADGHAAHTKKLDDEARSLAAEAKRLAAEAKRVAHEAEVARRNADHAAAEAAHAAKRAKIARSEADRADTKARALDGR